MNGKVLLPEFTVVLLAVLILSVSQSVYADGIVSVTHPAGHLLGRMSAPAPPDFYVPFVDIVEGQVSLLSGSYTFEVTVASRPTDWLSRTWNPSFAGLLDQPSIAVVRYSWIMFDYGGHQLGWIAVEWDQGVVQVFVRQCSAYQQALCDSQVNLTPHSLSGPVISGNSLSVTISQSYFSQIFPTADQWRVESSAATSGPPVDREVTDRAPDLGCTQQPAWITGPLVCLPSTAPLPT